MAHIVEQRGENQSLYKGVECSFSENQRIKKSAQRAILKSHGELEDNHGPFPAIPECGERQAASDKAI
jgi:hypothetical protein